MTQSTPLEKSPLLALPPELLVEIFQSAPSLEAAAKLAAASKQLYGIWRQYLTPIYNTIAPNSVLAHSALRGMLADLGHIPLGTQPVTLDHIGRVVKASKIGDGFVKAHNTSVEWDSYHDPQIPEELSAAETRRFVRAHYQILGLLCLDKTKQEQRIKELDLKTLFLLSDFLCVFDPHIVVDEDLREILDSAPIAHRYLQQELRSQRNADFKRLFDRRYKPIWNTPYESGGRHAWWCDCQQETFRKMLTGRVFRGDNGKMDISKVRDDIWYDSEEE
ncbi:hypothetical protein BDW62DRAFT_211981 [Aspergillus aurantiobrunneus]